MTTLRKLLHNNKAATALEYAFIASLISIAGITGMQAMGAQSSVGWDGVWNKTKAMLGY